MTVLGRETLARIVELSITTVVRVLNSTGNILQHCMRAAAILDDVRTRVSCIVINRLKYSTGAAYVGMISRRVGQ